MENSRYKFRVWNKVPNNNPEEKPVMQYGAEDWAAFGSICKGKYPSLILMQFTGLKDKNGKEIFEGDVVKWLDDYGMGDVREFTNEVKFIGGYFEPVINMPSEEFEIIGNIYENPELLS